ncbi:Lipase 2 [Escovopsis weberi]|uniref:Lipase 2 n=1 Tax=Escovopsis weberi TaxID=150374 RepID=A0A0M8N5R2_ESCWE|nr:Lipase 2 [Escovopsis weberi]
MPVLQRRLLTTSRALRTREILDDFAHLRKSYQTPKYPIVLAHGLLGFAEISLHPRLPTIRYWASIQEALAGAGATVLATSVPPSGSVPDRAAQLAAQIGRAAHPVVNIVAHSMGGLDARYMIARGLNDPALRPADSSSPDSGSPDNGIRPQPFRVASLVTIATPHRGSAYADHLLRDGGPFRRLYPALRAVGLGTDAFEQLTTTYARDTFNPAVPDDPRVRYFSYGAAISSSSSSSSPSSSSSYSSSPTSSPRRLGLLDPLRGPHRIVQRSEGPNDGLVSVRSSRWGTYRGTLVGVSHLDLIDWTSRLRWAVGGLAGGQRPSFNAVAFYMAIADMLAKEGL